MTPMVRHFAILIVLAAPLAFAETVTVRSGNGNVGGRDGSVTFLQGPSIGDFDDVLTSTDFSNAQNGPAAFILSPHPLWISGLREDSSAKWIGTNANSASSGDTALYAISFNLAAPFSSATLTLHYAADDTPSFLRGGFFLNGTIICPDLIEAGFSQEHTLSCDVGTFLQPGTNWLYLDITNFVTQSPAGLLFSATITTSDILRPTISGVGNAASYSVGASVAPGSIVTAKGNFLLGSPSIAPSSLPWPTSLSGVSVLLDAVQAPLYSVSGTQINFQVPWELAGQTQSAFTATVGAQITIPRALNLAPFAPGIFSMNGQGNGQGIVRDSQGQLVDISNPATAGDVIQIYCTGLGAVDPKVQTGALTPGDTPVSTTTLPTVTIGDAPAAVLFSGLAPGEVGLYRVDALVPDGSARGPSVPVAIRVGEVTSNTVTVAIAPFPLLPQQR